MRQLLCGVLTGRLSPWPRLEHVDVLGLGEVMFCHGTPRSEVECYMPFDRMIGSTRVVNAGSVGMPFGAPGAN